MTNTRCNALNDQQGSMIFLGTKDLTSQTSVTFDEFSSTYDNYVFVFSNVTYTSSPDSFQMTYATSGGTISANYGGSAKNILYNATSWTNVATTTYALLCNSSAGYSGNLNCFSLTNTTNSPTFSGFYADSGSPSLGLVQYVNTTSPINSVESITFYTGSGSGFAGGTISLYGIAST